MPPPQALLRDIDRALDAAIATPRCRPIAICCCNWSASGAACSPMPRPTSPEPPPGEVTASGIPGQAGRMIGEIDIYGVFVPILLVWGVIALPLTAVLRRVPGPHRLLSAGLAPAAGGPVAARHHHGGRRRRPAYVDRTMKPFLRRLAVNLGRPALTLLIVAAAVVAGRGLWAYYQDAPWTRDGRVRADVVTIAPDVSGLVTQVLVHDNQTVKRGDVLFRIDPDRFELALAQADAAMANRKAQMDEAVREATRYERLNELSVSKETQEQRQTTADVGDSGLSAGGGRPGGGGSSTCSAP